MADIYLLIKGKREGPFTKEEVAQSVGWGFIPDDVPARQEGVTDWVEVGRLIGFPEGAKPWKSTF